MAEGQRDMSPQVLLLTHGVRRGENDSYGPGFVRD